MSIVSQIFQSAGSRIVHVPASEVDAYVAELNGLRNPDGDPSIPDLTVTDWRFFEKAFLIGFSGHLIKQATPRQLQPVVQAALPVASAVLTAPQPVPLAPKPVTVPTAANLPVAAVGG